MAQQSILIISNEIIWHRLLKRIFGDTGYSVYAAGTCAEGIKLAEINKPDCVVLDFHMTDGDAIAMCADIRAIKNTKTIPVIILGSDPSARSAAYSQCQADNFILKGGALEELLTAISDALAPAQS